jgi:HEPN domain-containing protein
VPSESEHLQRAKHNLAFARFFDLKTTPWPDWAVVGYFYAALHLVDALLAREDKVHPETHEIRRELVRTKRYLREIRSEYRNLKDHSDDARYRLITFTSIKIERDVIPLYEQIENHIVRQLERK